MFKQNDSKCVRTVMRLAFKRTSNNMLTTSRKNLIAIFRQGVPLISYHHDNLVYKTQVTTFDPCTVRNFFTTIWRLKIEIMMCVKVKSTCNQNLIFNFFSFTILVRTFNMPIIIGYIHAIYHKILVVCAWLLDISKSCRQISWMHTSTHPLKQVWCEKYDYLLYTSHFWHLCEHSSLLSPRTQYEPSEWFSLVYFF